jgi:hypothetical protein
MRWVDYFVKLQKPRATQSEAGLRRLEKQRHSHVAANNPGCTRAGVTLDTVGKLI